MEKKMNNKGFSLVELIIVIAIMAVLIGILAPQYLGYVARSRVSADITNAQEMAQKIAINIADNETGGTHTVPTAATAADAEAVTAAMLDGTTVPECRVNAGYAWTVYVDNNTVHILCNDSELYPSVATGSDWDS